MASDRESGARDESMQALLNGIFADAAAGRLVGVMERYNVLEQMGVSDCREAGCLSDEDQWVAEFLMDYYNRKG